jgi:hypothetical protein
MNPRLGEDIMVGDTPEEFAHCVVQLLEQPVLRKILSRNGRELVIRSYSFQAVAARIDQIICDLNTIPVKRYPQPKRLALKWRFDLSDLLQRYVLWKFRQSA